MENPHLEHYLDLLQALMELKKVLQKVINLNYGEGRRAATCGRTKGSFSLQTWKMKQWWSKPVKSWKSPRACSLISVSGNCLRWRNTSVLRPSKCRLSGFCSDSQAAVCSYQQFASKPGSVRTELQPNERNVKTGIWLCVLWFLHFTPVLQPLFLLTRPKGPLSHYFCCLPVVSDD